ncbi:PKD-like family lipoprotein [Gelidibacter maritimus]|uniref:PKD-like family protein n=1 Tax=Gelidibacter maritimus TaxID=2761487 RepID=A0A7W2M3K0_9FLAO|nr:PKD-like family lipoprotein [Gelidibacter maritimus]MBA6152047.1 hypothetical protein [Gelidibacter maritimus]
MMKKIFIFLLSVVMIIAINSCYNDTGNYDYSQLSNVTITAQDTVYVTQFNTLTVPVEIDLDGMAEDDYTYSWRLWSNEIGNKLKKSISDTKELSYEVVEVPGSYTLVFTTTNKLTNVSEYKTIDLMVQGVISEGWMVLQEKDGKTDFDLIMSPYFSERHQEDIILRNLYESVNGEPLQGHGLKISNYFALGRYQYVVILTDEGGVRLSATTMQKTYDLSTLMFDEKPLQPENYFYFDYYWCLGRGNEVIISDGRYYINELLGEGYTEPILKDGETYRASKWGPKQLWTFKGMIYDELNGRFLGIQNPYLTATPLPEAVGRKFDWNNMGAKLLYMDTGFKHYDYGLMEDWDTQELSLYVLNFDVKNNFDVAMYSADNIPELANAKYYAIGERGNVFFYATDKDIYLYDYAGSNTGNKAHSVPIDERITNMKIFKPLVDRYITSHPYDNKILILSTHNDNTGEGKIYMYKFNESVGTIEKESEKVFDGFGRILDMDYNYAKYGS